MTGERIGVWANARTGPVGRKSRRGLDEPSRCRGFAPDLSRLGCGKHSPGNRAFTKPGLNGSKIYFSCRGLSEESRLQRRQSHAKRLKSDAEARGLGGSSASRRDLRPTGPIRWFTGFQALRARLPSFSPNGTSCALDQAMRLRLLMP